MIRDQYDLTWDELIYLEGVKYSTFQDMGGMCHVAAPTRTEGIKYYLYNGSCDDRNKPNPCGYMSVKEIDGEWFEVCSGNGKTRRINDWLVLI